MGERGNTMVGQEQLKSMISEYPEYQDILYSKGFLITDDQSFIADEFPVSWKVTTFGKYSVWHDEKLPLFMHENLLLLGHAYHPYEMEKDENKILRNLSALTGDAFWQYESGLTGNHVIASLESDNLCHWADCAGMLVSYYGEIDGYYYVTSHVNLVVNHLKLTEDPYITKLKSSRYFKLFGVVLPGDLSPVKEMKRTVPNYCYRSNGSYFRFFPLNSITECHTEEEYQEVLKETSTILKRTLQLCAEKWPEKVAISVTGGKDSGVSLASANGYYNAFHYFSYISKPEEAVDADAAAKICESLGLTHTIYKIDENNANFPDYDCMRELIAYNGGSVGYLKSNEIRKRITFLHSDFPFAVEVKSWVDEVSRAYWYKKYNKKHFPIQPTGRYLAALYKVFLENRLLFKQTADVFNEYIKKYMTAADIALVGDWLTLWSWEFGHSAGEGQHMTDEQTLTHDVTVPFNNRRLISTMLRPNLQDRINDRLQSDIIRRNNLQQAELGIEVVNAAHTGKRALAEKIYLEINAHSVF